MKFGPVPLSDAEGAVLAHSVGLNGKRRLRKGRSLDENDIKALEAAGLSEVIVAKLDPEDVHENPAAQALAEAFAPDPAAQGLELTQAFTGRVNLLAVGPGIVQLDVAAIEAVNRVHPMITIATVPPFQQMQRGGMVATIKIISYAVPSAALDAACAQARAAIRLLAPQVRNVRLVVSDIEGGAGDKGWRAIAQRVAAFDLELPRPVVVAHTVWDLADALTAGESDLTLILTGSATSDIDDVAPQAVRAAGGTVARFGMPVDPGNLLFIGSLGKGGVIGLPGCARSPALNGADWVMARMICGVALSDDDISGMGVGGLLKEIPTRPQPRRAAASKQAE
ncbi:molybdopterin biosynthesis protein [Roseobacter denitrificans]|uniref:Molybdopterin biosynthesis protein, putative n=1 Tax=Roseobacter denitrificans (strain ATCC 33942 / OCh 114) TaxID=375451 RepID=Q164U8_ROSDO|nr:molybdopterin-binding protein [Roseobacter denitrificans]ABG32495.1 molybdopterin biosynthesis protein, putative [Roseobacter denitrificans OCh 114]AVL51952.1 molybdopterin biosynthesis protein [Roseobacter denitrificans]SFF82594.1 molybdenum cofactor cytidylyltransferase [Roseobacter denitrificans OCh 114]